MTFKEQFSEPVCFSDGSWVIDGSFDKEDAREWINEYMFEAGTIDEPLLLGALDRDYVRFGYAPVTVEDLAGELCWYTCTPQKGAQEVWIVRA